MELIRENSDFNNTLAPWIGKTAKMMHWYINEVFQKNEFQITKEQWIVLKILHDDCDGIVQNKLAFVTNRNKASLTRLIHVMEKNNLVARIPSKADSRKNLIFITKRGKQLFLQSKPILLESIEHFQKGITPNEKEVFISIMKKIQNNLENNKLSCTTN